MLYFNSNQKLWAITSYFNPCKYQRRLNNYKIFRKYLSIPLVTVEISFDQQFELTTEDAEILIQIPGNPTNLMWQKERLLNISIQALPDECQAIAILDCDIIFKEPEILKTAYEHLENFKFIQLFKNNYHLTRESSDNLDIENIDYLYQENSFAFNLFSGHDINKRGYLENRNKDDVNLAAPGMAWMISRDILNDFKLYDACILGGGDTAISYAACNQIDLFLERRKMPESHRKHYLQWANLFNTLIQEKIGFVDCNLLHLWHGNIGDRQYLSRHKKLQEVEFDPDLDICLDENNCWRWNSDKPDLHQYVRQYFYSRREDG